MTDSLILAGGKSTRFKSDKALEKFNSNDLTNVEYIARTTLSYVDHCYVSTNKNNYQVIKKLFSHDSKITVISDIKPFIDCGPMSAVWSYFKVTKQSLSEVVIIATDYLISKETIAFICQKRGYLKVDQVPFYTCCHLILQQKNLIKQFDSKNLRWRDFINESQCLPIVFNGKIKNINYRSDLT